jgi:hypothetical protein
LVKLRVEGVNLFTEGMYRADLNLHLDGAASVFSLQFNE